MMKRLQPQGRWVVALTFLLLLAGVVFSMPGSNSTVIAQQVPTIEEVLPFLEKSEGVINAYRTPQGRLFMEITEDHFEKDFLVVIQMDKGIGESFMLTGYPLFSEMVTFRWRNEKIELVYRNPNFRAEEGTPEGRMVDLGFRESVKHSYDPVAATPDEGRYMIDVTNTFVADWASLADFLPGLYGVFFQMDPSRSELVSVKGFEENVEIRVDLSFLTSGPIPSNVIPHYKTLPVGISYSILALPEEPMQPRLSDDRIGYFTTTYRDFNIQGGASDAVRLANRWRLEKKHPNQPLSEPVKPIVFYLENTIPEEYRPYIKAGIEEWGTAFRRAGFINAIIAKDQPDDPDWSPGDARHSTIRWVSANDSVFAIGPSDVDPRTGEILNADILFVSDWVRVLNGQNQQLVNQTMSINEENEFVKWYSQINPDYAQMMCDYASSMGSELMLMRQTLIADGLADANGELPLQYIGEALMELTMHEVGHTLGLRHNFKGSSAIPFDQLHDEALTQSFGVSGSVMDYNPPNISLDRSEQGEYYNSVVGAYDMLAIKWGYMPVRNERLASHPELAAVASESTEKSYNTFGTDEDTGLGSYAMDPYITTYDLSADPVRWFKERATLVNELWDSVEDRLIADGDEYWPLRYAVQSMLIQKVRGYPYAARGMGGVSVTRAHKGNDFGVLPMMPLSAQEQRDALDYVLGLYHPDVFADFPTDLLNKMPRERWWDFASSWQNGSRFTYSLGGFLTSIRGLTLSVAFDPERLMRVRDQTYHSDEANPFELYEMFEGFSNAIWADVLAGNAPTDAYQREIQNVHIDMLGGIGGLQTPQVFSVSGDAPTVWVSDARALALAEMERLKTAIEAVLEAGVDDHTAEAHLKQALKYL